MEDREAWIITPYPVLDRRISEVLAETGLMLTQIKTAKQLPNPVFLSRQSTVILYQKTAVTETLRELAALVQQRCCQVILLLDPDKYILHLDAARAAGISLLLMPFSRHMLTDLLTA